jgi:nucleotide-binding universal stress UspA family protein
LLQTGRRRILVATDGSEVSIGACRWLAGLLDPATTDVRLITVLTSGLRSAAFDSYPSDDADARLGAESAVESATGVSCDVLEGAGIRVEVTHRFGNPSDALLAEIEEWAPDLMVMGRRGLGFPARWLMGSVTDRVLRNARCPVLIVP